MKYALITYSRKGVINIGDDIQLISMMEIYKKIGVDEKEIVRINFHDLSTYDGEAVILPVSFPFYGYNEDMCVTVFSEKIYPVFLGLSLLNTNIPSRDIAYLKKFEPIGCRDAHTADGLKRLGIDTYLFGCITLTLPRRETKKNDKHRVYCVDVYPEVYNYMPETVKNQVEERSHIFYVPILDTLEFARELLSEYSEKASLIVTSRLHCALPCIAMGLPVILVHRLNNYRFSWLEDITTVYTPDLYHEINWDTKPHHNVVCRELQLEVVKKRLLGKECDQEVAALSAYFNHRQKRKYVIDSLEFFKAYLSTHWDKEKPHCYIVWGVIQHAAVLIEFIKEHYPKAELVGVIDTYKRVEFYGQSCKPAEETIIKNETVFVAASAAAKKAQQYLLDIGKNMEEVCIWSTQGMGL